jgi:hypothetical protein
MKLSVLRLALLIAVACPAAMIRAADTKTDTPSQPKAAAKDSTDDSNAKSDAKGRLPRNYGKIGISSDQKAKIYQIESDFSPRIKALRDQLSALTAQEDKEIRALLTADQLKKLDELNAETRARRNGGKPMDDPGAKATTNSSSPKGTTAKAADPAPSAGK